MLLCCLCVLSEAQQAAQMNCCFQYPAIQIGIPREVPPDPSYTDSMTPLVSTTRDTTGILT